MAAAEAAARKAAEDKAAKEAAEEEARKHGWEQGSFGYTPARCRIRWRLAQMQPLFPEARANTPKRSTGKWPSTHRPLSVQTCRTSGNCAGRLSTCVWSRHVAQYVSTFSWCLMPWQIIRCVARQLRSGTTPPAAKQPTDRRKGRGCLLTQRPCKGSTESVVTSHFPSRRRRHLPLEG